MIKSKNLLIKQGIVSGVKHRSKTIGVGARLNVGTSLKNTQNKRRKIVADANYNNFDPEARIAIKEYEAWQRRVFAKNARAGYRFFQPDVFDRPTPRSAREAWGAPYESEDRIEKDEKLTNRIMLGLFLTFVVVLSIL